jgi:hypothetical protein
LNLIQANKTKNEKDGACSTHGERRSEYMILVGIPEGKEPLERPKHRWGDNIKMGLQNVEWGMDWIDLAQNRDRWQDFVNAVKKLLVPSDAGNFLTS